MFPSHERADAIVVQPRHDTELIDDAERNELAVRYFPLVRHVVQELSHRLPRHEDRDDLEAAGAAGLLQAAQAWDPARGVPFERYAKLRVRGAVLDELRSSDWVSRSVRTRARRLRDANDALIAQLGRQPTTDELAERLATSAEEVESIRADLARGALVNLTPEGDDGGQSRALSMHDPESVILDREQRAYLRDAVSQLPERHRLVVIGYYLEERPMAELARFLGVTESRISQIRSEALLMLRDGINSQLDPDSLPVNASNRVMRRRAGYYAAIADHSTFRARVSDRTVIVPPAVVS